MMKEGVGTPDGALEMVKGQMALTLTEKIHPETGDKTRRRWKSRGMEYKVFGTNCSKTVEEGLKCQLGNFISRKDGNLNSGKSALAHQSSWNSHGGPGKSEGVPEALWRWDLGQNGRRCRRKLHRNSKQDTIHGGWTGKPELFPETNTSTESP